MKTSIDVKYLDHPDIAEADAILRSCVHCGFVPPPAPPIRSWATSGTGPAGASTLSSSCWKVATSVKSPKPTWIAA
ncbi:hypothetical protein MBH78_06570 [Oceanimonas sp. NS1]|nr:hypothetical protein [Oceanimonas sp. NS1]